jgi:hypothetical protein
VRDTQFWTREAKDRMDIKEQDRNLVEHYLSSGDVGEFCRANNIKERRYCQFLNSFPENPRRPRVSKAQKKPLSKLHERLGRRLFECYQDAGLDRLMASNRLGWNPQVLRLVEQGLHDLTLFEILDMAAFMRCKIQDLVDGR